MEDLSRWDFIEALKKEAVKYRKTTPRNIRLKLDKVFNSYSKLMPYYTFTETERMQKKLSDLEYIVKSLKSGVVEFSGGFCVVSDIECVQIKNDSIIVSLKSGKEISFVKEMDWLLKLK